MGGGDVITAIPQDCFIEFCAVIDNTSLDSSWGRDSRTGRRGSSGSQGRGVVNVIHRERRLSPREHHHQRWWCDALRRAEIYLACRTSHCEGPEGDLADLEGGNTDGRGLGCQ